MSGRIYSAPMVAGGTGSFPGYDNIIRSDPPLTRYHIDEEVVRRKDGHSPHQDFGRPDAFLGEHGVRTLEDRDSVQLGAVVGNDKAPRTALTEEFQPITSVGGLAWYFFSESFGR
jgi:hypothetical protein